LIFYESDISFIDRIFMSVHTLSNFIETNKFFIIFAVDTKLCLFILIYGGWW
jgi:hypothetical protein